MTQEHRSGTRPPADPFESSEPEQPETLGAAWPEPPDVARAAQDPPEQAAPPTSHAPHGAPVSAEDPGMDPSLSPTEDVSGAGAAQGLDPVGEYHDYFQELQMALHAAEAARDEYLEDLRRTQAEFQNYRKRVMREGTAQREQGVSDVLTRLLDVVDDFELAVLAAETVSEAAGLRKGIEMVYGKLVGLLRAFGLEKVAEEGVTFNPEWHEAVQQVEDGVAREQPVVVEVLRPGYLLNGRVLRPAMVKVAR